MSVQSCEKYTATLSEILAITPAVQTVADATDVPGVRLEWMKTTENPTGAWFGDLGTMPKATADALHTSGALANLATGATYRDTSGISYTYSAGAGWVADKSAILPIKIATGESASFWLLGSSSTQYCSTPNVDPSASSAEFNEWTDGYWYAVCSRYSTGWRLRYNSGTATHTTAQIWAKMQTDFATVSGYTHVILQLNANDLPTNPADYTNSTNCLNLALSTGARVVLVVPHMTGASTNYAGYEAYQAWCYSMAEKYPSVVDVVSHFRAFSGQPVGIGQYSNDAIHLNTLGTYVASSQWAYAAKKYGSVITDDIRAFGPVLHDFNLATGTKSNATVTTDADGAYVVTSSASLASVASPAITVVASDVYRIFVDYEIIATVTDNYNAGARAFIGSVPKRFGIRNTSDSSQSTQIGRYRIMGAPFTPGATSLLLTFYPGASGAIAKVRRFGLVKISS